MACVILCDLLRVDRLCDGVQQQWTLIGRMKGIVSGSEAAGNADMHAESATAVWTTTAASIDGSVDHLYRGLKQDVLRYGTLLWILIVNQTAMH